MTRAAAHQSPPQSRTPARPVHVLLLTGTALCAALYLSWLTLAAADFLYPLWYDVADIGDHIDEYAPQNRYREGFEDTSREARLAAFAAIAESVRRDARGLAALTYTNASDRPRTLLRPPEIVHLQDVARLITVVERGGLLATLLLGAGLYWLRRGRVHLPGAGRMAAATVLGVTAVALLVVLLGPVAVFYRFHEWVFPEGHQWFFYYQESLMSTLMKAPDLFGYIAATLVLLAVVYLVLLLVLARRVVTGRSVPR